MKFIKVQGIYDNPEMDKSLRDRHESNRITRVITEKTQNFNDVAYVGAKIFIASLLDGKANISIIMEGNINIDRMIEKYLRCIDLKLNEISYYEITLNDLIRALRCASRYGFIDRDEDILSGPFKNIDELYCKGVSYDENMIPRLTSKRVALEESLTYLSDNYLTKELTRIFNSTREESIYGHPVQYLVETDDRDTRRDMYKLLLSSLYFAKRIENRRYTFVDIHMKEFISKVEYDRLYSTNTGGAIVIRYDKTTLGEENEFASHERDNLKVIGEVAKKYHNDVLTIFCFPRECNHLKEVLFESLSDISVVEIKEDAVGYEASKEYLKNIAVCKKVKTDRSLYKEIDKNGTYIASDLKEIFDKWYDKRLKTKFYPDYSDEVSVKVELAKKEHKGDSFLELNSMIGLANAKKVINEALDYYKAQKIFKSRGMKIDNVSMHMVFTGNPGTAKTTVARLFARIMRDNGILSRGHLVEVGRADLVGQYVGWTAPLVKRKFSEAKGGVLFIDEAYSLLDDRSGLYGDEAINTIVSEMENNREDVVVIFAGYPKEMEKFLEKNPGLRSRIAFHVPFDDYSTDELIDIARFIAKDKGVTITEDGYTKLGYIFDRARTNPDFGNGRYVRNIIERAKMAQASRILKLDPETIKDSDICTIEGTDIEDPMKFSDKNIKKIGFAC